MSLFEYIMVLTSILISLGIAELLYGVVRMLKSDFKEGFFLPQVLWAVFLFLHLIIIWWSRWDLRDTMEWNFNQLLLSLAGPVLIFILAGLVFPHKRTAQVYYFAQRKVFFSILAVVPIVDFCHEVLIEGTEIISTATVIIAILFTAIVWSRFSENETIHTLMAIIATGVILTFISMTTYLLN